MNSHSRAHCNFTYSGSHHGASQYDTSIVQVVMFVTPRTLRRARVWVAFAILALALVYVRLASLLVPTAASETSLLLNSFVGDGGSNSTVDSDAAVTTVAYAVSITGCGNQPIVDAAAVLQHTIHRASVRGSLGGKYDYAMYAIYHPNATHCATALEQIGYNLLERDTFVRVEDIQGEFLRKRISKSGCCGEKELIKFEAYTLTDYPIVVHLDLDVIVLKPMDDVFDLMMKSPGEAPLPADALMWPDRPLPRRINAIYTKDYLMSHPLDTFKPVQGGFLVIRPSLEVYEELREIVRVGDFRENRGWGGVTGVFWGSVTFQGLVPYYYHLHGNQSVELNRCVYNHMSDPPKKDTRLGERCLTGEEECEDCRERPLEDIVSAHFVSQCGKPWQCGARDQPKFPLCRKLVHEWYRARTELERSWGRTGTGESTWQTDLFYGHCKHGGAAGYLRIKEPYRKPPERRTSNAA